MFFYAPQQIAFQGTLTGLRVSTVNGVALIDNAGAVVPTFADGSHSIEIFAAGLLLKGVLSSQGVAETLGGDRLSALMTYSAGSGLEYETFTTTGPDNLIAVNTGGSGRAWTDNTLGTTGGELMKLTLDCVLNSGVGPEIRTLAGQAITAPAVPYIPALSSGSLVAYATETTGTRYWNMNTVSGEATDVVITNQYLKQVLTPSNAGAVIVAAKGSATQNWGINQWVAGSYNLASYQVVVRKLR